MGKRHDPSSPYADAEGNVTTYENTMNFPGRGVAGNVLGAIGGFLSTKEGETATPRNTVGAGGRPVLPTSSRTSTAPAGGGTGAFPGMLTPRRSGNTVGEWTGSRSTNNATARGWMPSIFPKAQNLTGRPVEVGMANSVTNASGGRTTRVRPGETMPVTANNQRVRAGLQPVIRTAAQQRALPVTANNQRVRGVNAQGQPARNVSGNAVIRTSAQQKALPVTANRQRVADVNAAKRPLSEAQDPYNWAGIARDLGNAGDVRWASHKTGALPSSSAKRFVATNQASARAEVNRGRTQQSASATAAPARRTASRGRNRAV